MTWLWAALTPHPPVLVPEVGQGREKEAGATLQGMRSLVEALSSLHAHAVPDWLLLLSPHAPYVPGALFVSSAARIQGNLARFGAPKAQLRAETPQKALRALAALLKRGGIPAAFGATENISQDHGTLVPLLLLRASFPEAELPPILIVNPSGLSPEQALRLGELLGEEPWQDRPALLASGDLSHRLKEDGPYGFNSAGPVFDKALVEALKQGRANLLLELPASVREKAAECGLRPALTLLGLCGGPLRIFSYEGPFGVGYCTALWQAEGGN